jgi:NADPH:quinone reductase-like Zn-dependent oxidoreductase
VTAVTSTGNLDLVRSLGADQVVDYTTTDFARGGRRYDRILDTVGNRSVADLRRVLAPGGRAAVTGFTSVARLLGVSLRGGKDVAQVQAHVTTSDLELLSELIEAGRLRPQIDRRYRFADTPAAIAYLEQGHARGKVVVALTAGSIQPYGCIYADDPRLRSRVPGPGRHHPARHRPSGHRG